MSYMSNTGPAARGTSRYFSVRFTDLKGVEWKKIISCYNPRIFIHTDEGQLVKIVYDPEYPNNVRFGDKKNQENQKVDHAAILFGVAFFVLSFLIILRLFGAARCNDPH